MEFIKVGSIVNKLYDYGVWWIVLFNVLLFGIFVLGFLRPKKKYEWRSLGLFVAFIVALFTGMYAFPLTIYVFLSVYGNGLSAANPFQHVNGHLLGSILGAPQKVKLIIYLLGGLLTLVGLIIMGKAWKQIHQAGGHLVTTGVYNYIRHPHYLGLFFITIGMLIQWTTIITVAMWSILTYAYYQLSMKEKQKAMEKFVGKYIAYQQTVPTFIPKRNLRGTMNG